MLRVVGTDGVFYFGIWGEIDKLSSKLGDFYILAEIKKCGKLINMSVLSFVYKTHCFRCM